MVMQLGHLLPRSHSIGFVATMNGARHHRLKATRCNHECFTLCHVQCCEKALQKINAIHFDFNSFVA